MSITDTITETVADTVKSIESWSLEAIKTGEDAMLSATKTVAESLEPLTDRLPTAPVTDGLPQPKRVVTGWFDYLEKVLAQQKHFSVQLASTLAPTHTTSRRSTTKSARSAA